MKYGLLYYKDTGNIGDDIQSYAASKFLPKIDYMIDRENIEMFAPSKKEKVATIMNAWYIHDGFNFNISPYIYPLYTSVFFKYIEYYKGIEVGSDYLNRNVIKSLKNYGPVGCRDNHTKKMLNKLGVESYFSGCLTLTLDKFSSVEKGNYIVVNGLSKDEIKYIKSKTKRKIIEFKQDVKKKSFSDETWEERKKRVEDVLKLYQGAYMVITTKLHCSLPCLALETPVLLLYDTSCQENKDRIGSYLTYLNYINRNELKKVNIDFDKPKKNKTKYLELRKKLIEQCKNFVQTSKGKKHSELLPEIEYYLESKKDERNTRKVVIKHLNLLQNKYCVEKKDYEEEIRQLKNNIGDLNYKYSELSRKYDLVINSKGWKILEKLRNFKLRN